MNSKKVLLISIFTIGLTSLANTDVPMPASEEVQMVQDKAMTEQQQMEFLIIQEISMSALVDFISKNINMVKAVIKSDNQGSQKVADLIVKYVNSYLQEHADQMLKAVAEKFGLRQKEQIDLFVNNYRSVVSNSLPFEVQQYLLVESQVYAALYGKKIQIKR